jgi:hypothetical protein
MGGNVSEWCADFYAPYEPGEVTDPLQRNSNLSDKPRIVLRGGSWARDPKNTRSAARFRSDARSRNADTGFRVVCAVSKITTPAPTVAGPTPMTLPRMNPTNPPPAPLPPAPSHFESAHEASSGSSSFGIGGLLCFLMPVAFVMWLVFKIFRRLTGGGSPAATQARMTGTGLGMAASPFGQRSTPPAGGKRGVRLVDDGFWLLLDAPRGTPIRYSYRPSGGMDVTGEVAYEPGAEGHFVYTGSAPESVRILDAGGAIDPDQLSTGSMYDSGPGAHIGPTTTGFRSSSSGQHRSSSSSSSSSRYPAAY